MFSYVFPEEPLAFIARLYLRDNLRGIVWSTRIVPYDGRDCLVEIPHYVTAGYRP